MPNSVLNPSHTVWGDACTTMLWESTRGSHLLEPQPWAPHPFCLLILYKPNGVYVPPTVFKRLQRPASGSLVSRLQYLQRFSIPPLDRLCPAYNIYKGSSSRLGIACVPPTIFTRIQRPASGSPASRLQYLQRFVRPASGSPASRLQYLQGFVRPDSESPEMSCRQTFTTTPNCL